MERKDWGEYMDICEELANSASEKGNTPVGCIIVLDGEIIGKGEEAAHSKEDISCHAEMEAVREARKLMGKDLSGAILLSTKEPCVLCSYAIRFHRINTVIYKDEVSHLGGATGPFPILTTTEVPENWAPPVKIVPFATSEKKNF